MQPTAFKAYVTHLIFYFDIWQFTFDIILYYMIISLLKWNVLC